MKVLILIILAYLGYRLFKIWFLPEKSTREMAGRAGLTPVDDIMVQDPCCGTYVPRERAVKHRIKGKTFYFCSTACRDKYTAKVKGQS